MTESLTIIGILFAYWVAVWIMKMPSRRALPSPKRQMRFVDDWISFKPKTMAYDPAEDPEKVLTGEVESYFD